MKPDKDKELDDLFKKGLGEPVYDAGYREEDWNTLEQMMDRPKKRGGIVFWLPILSGAAVLLILVGWWLLRPAVMHQRQKQQQAMVIKSQSQNIGTHTAAIKQHAEVIHQQQKTYESAAPLQNKTTVKAEKEAAAAYAGNSKAARRNLNSKPGLNQDTRLADNTGTISYKKKNLGSADDKKKDLGSADDKTAGPGQEEKLTRPGSTELAAVSESVTIGGASANKPNSNSMDILPKNIGSTSIALAKHKATKSWLLNHPQYTLSFIGAPELNGVNSLQQARTGSTLGVLFSAGLFKKLTFSTGALYAVKPYSSSFSIGSHTFINDGEGLTKVNADCRVLDIPLNADYQLYNKHQNKFSIGTGFSSYIMLHESYQYNYAGAGNGIANYTVPNTNKYFFSILNLQATYTRQINSKVGISMQPYLKLPLTGIGASQARLQTAGVAIGLNWNLNSLSKP